MPLPLIPLGYAAAALVAAYAGKKAYDKVREVKATAQGVKEAAGAASAAVENVAESASHAREGATQTVNKLVDSATEFTNTLHGQAHSLKMTLLTTGAAILDAWAAVSAFYVGLMAGFGIHFLRLIDKVSLFHELVFYATIISALHAPATLVTAIVVSSNRKQGMQWTVPALAVTAVVVTFAVLDYFYAICFCVSATVLLFLAWLRPHAFGRAFYTVCALVFGFLYAETLVLQKPDTKIIATDATPVKVTLLMSTPRGLIGLDENRQMAHYAWSSVVSVSVEQGATKFDGLRELLKSGRTAFDNGVLPTFK